MTPALSHQTYQAIQSAQELLDKGQSAKALQRLEALLKQTDKSIYEQAVVLQPWPMHR